MIVELADLNISQTRSETSQQQEEKSDMIFQCDRETKYQHFWNWEKENNVRIQHQKHGVQF